MCEDAPCCGCCGGDTFEHEPETAGWPGDGSGEDDLADYNQNEADDYGNEDGGGDCQTDDYPADNSGCQTDCDE